MESYQIYNKNICLNGTDYNQENLNKIDKSSLQSWEIKIIDFLSEWVSDAKSIAVNTSGSTGTPKTILLSKNSMVQNAKFTGNYLGLKKGDRALLNLPVDFIGGKMMIVRAFVLGLKLFTIQPSSALIVKDNYIFGAMTPHQLKSSYRSDASILDKFQILILGGSSVDDDLLKLICNSSCLCYSSYGMTETSSHIALKALNGQGKKEAFELTDSSIKIKSDSDSCLEIHAPYLENSSVKTRDVVSIVDERHFIWKGRFDLVINSGGYKIHPELLEQKLNPYFSKRFFIFGAEHEFYGQRPALLIESKQEKSSARILKILKTHLNKLEIPDQIFILERFFETANGKINREACIESAKKIFEKK